MESIEARLHETFSFKSGVAEKEIKELKTALIRTFHDFQYIREHGMYRVFSQGEAEQIVEKIISLEFEEGF